MYARLTKIRIDIHKIDKASDLFEESVVPAFKAQKGYRGIYFMANRKEGECLCISLWNTEEDLIANEKSLSYQEQLIKFLDLFTESPFREGYEVLFQD
jgi:heme-degrading monooxygenase HmoA